MSSLAEYCRRLIDRGQTVVGFALFQVKKCFDGELFFLDISVVFPSCFSDADDVQFGDTRQLFLLENARQEEMLLQHNSIMEALMPPEDAGSASSEVQQEGGIYKIAS